MSKIYTSQTTVKQNTEEAISQASTKIVAQILKNEHLVQNDLVSIVFQASKELTTVSPAKGPRTQLGLSETCFFAQYLPFKSGHKLSVDITVNTQNTPALHAVRAATNIEINNLQLIQKNLISLLLNLTQLNNIRKKNLHKIYISVSTDIDKEKINISKILQKADLENVNYEFTYDTPISPDHPMYLARAIRILLHYYPKDPSSTPIPLYLNKTAKKLRPDLIQPS